jgi:hypothetical protein
MTLAPGLGTQCVGPTGLNITQHMRYLAVVGHEVLHANEQGLSLVV